MGNTGLVPAGKRLWQPLSLLTLRMQGCLEKGAAFGRSMDPGSVRDHNPASMGKAMCQAVNGEWRIPVLRWQCCLLPCPPQLQAEAMEDVWERCRVPLIPCAQQPPFLSPLGFAERQQCLGTSHRERTRWQARSSLPLPCIGLPGHQGLLDTSWHELEVSQNQPSAGPFVGW